MSLLKYCLSIALLVSIYSLSAQDIQWMTWEEAVMANEKAPKKIFVDIYTSWCGWCKKMDVTTFKDTAVVSYLNANFYPIKLNAEQKESILWKDKEYPWMPHKRDGVNKLAHELLDGQLSYPTYVLMDSAFSRILISPGYMEVPAMLKELKFAAEDHYKTTSWQKYKARP